MENQNGPTETTTQRGRARKIVLPSFVLTELCNATDEGAVRIPLPVGATESVYYVRPRLQDTGQWMNGKPILRPLQFNMYPVVLDANGLPWHEANIYMLSRLEDVLDPDMSTYIGIGDDLAAYRRFLDEECIDWRNFPKQKLSRPTYRYSAHLSRAVESGHIADSSARRRMTSVIGLYRWLKKSKLLFPAYPEWQERDVYINLTGIDGCKYTKQVTTTDVSIKVPKKDDPYDGTIDDGGKLRPLSRQEQEWILEALFARDNTEMTLIHLMALTTGARIQTILTSRLRHFPKLTEEHLKAHPDYKIPRPVGGKTGVDTKRNKQMFLLIPLWLYRMLSTYVGSDRARHRRSLARGGDTEDQYLFLSKSGLPFYSSKKDRRTFDPTNKSRNPIKGQAIRKFMAEVIIPYVRAKYDPRFSYRFHDLRASYGMNLTEEQLKLVGHPDEKKRKTLYQVRDFVRECMGHDSTVTTDRYLNFKANLAHVQHVTDSHEDHLRGLTEKAGLL